MEKRPKLARRVHAGGIPPQLAGGGTGGRLAELESLFLNLVGTVENLTDRQAEANRRLAAFELERVAEGRAA